MSAVERVAAAIQNIDRAGIWDEETFALAAIYAHTAWLLEQGGVTDEEIQSVVWDEDPSRRFSESRDLIARAVATATAEKDAEIERLHAAWGETYNSALSVTAAAHTRADAAEAEVERLRATIARVEALFTEWGDLESTDNEWKVYYEGLRVALAGENGDTA